MLVNGTAAWMAPEVFVDDVVGQAVCPASDVYMLGSCFVELVSGCERTPFDWLTAQRLLVFRGQDTTRHLSCLQVKITGRVCMICCGLYACNCIALPVPAPVPAADYSCVCCSIVTRMCDGVLLYRRVMKPSLSRGRISGACTLLRR